MDKWVGHDFNLLPVLNVQIGTETLTLAFDTMCTDNFLSQDAFDRLVKAKAKIKFLQSTKMNVNIFGSKKTQLKEVNQIEVKVCTAKREGFYAHMCGKMRFFVVDFITSLPIYDTSNISQTKYTYRFIKNHPQLSDANGSHLNLDILVGSTTFGQIVYGYYRTGTRGEKSGSPHLKEAIEKFPNAYSIQTAFGETSAGSLKSQIYYTQLFDAAAGNVAACEISPNENFPTCCSTCAQEPLGTTCSNTELFPIKDSLVLSTGLSKYRVFESDFHPVNAVFDDKNPLWLEKQSNPALLAKNIILKQYECTSANFSTESVAGRKTIKAENCSKTLSQDVAFINLIQSFWQEEECPLESVHSVFNYNDVMMLDHLDKHMRYDADRKKYCVSFYFLDNNMLLCNNFSMAEARQKQLERNLLKKGENYFQAYSQVMEKTINDFSRELTPDEINQTQYCFYNPHFFVERPDSSSTPLRSVIDPAAKTPTGFSLNNTLYPGPKSQNCIATILVRARMGKIFVSSDISKCFNCIEIDNLSSQYQRFLWRESPNKPLKHYCFTHLTFGPAPSPFFSNLVLLTHAERFKNEYPIASELIFSKIFVDDLMASLPSVQEAKIAVAQINELCDKASMKMVKWNSNSKEVLASIDPERRSKESVDFYGTEILGSDHQVLSTLGLKYDPIADHFMFATPDYSPILSKPRLTKRLFSSGLAKLFDILGLISPVIVYVKILFQTLWEDQSISWDDNIPAETESKFRRWAADMTENVHKFTVPRYFENFDKEGAINYLIGFTDSSPKCMGCVLFLRTEYKGKISISLLGSRSKLVGIQNKHSIARLELRAMVLLTDYVNFFAQLLSIPLSRTYLYSDSKIALCWVAKEANLWSVYVRNRVLKIQNKSKFDNWSYISTKSNIADLLTRGEVDCKTLLESDWFRGPSFLHSKNVADFPQLRHFSEKVEEVNSELSKSNKVVDPPSSSFENIENENANSEGESIPNELICTANTVRSKNNGFILDWSRFSCYEKLLRTTGYFFKLLLFLLKLHKTNKGFKLTFMQARIELCGAISPSICNQADKFYISRIQGMNFQEEIQALKGGKEVGHKSKLLSLSPKFENGFLRMDSRIGDAAHVNYDEANPIILPSISSKNEHSLTMLKVKSIHNHSLHVGPWTTLSLVRQNFWIMKGYASIRNALANCNICGKFKRKAFSQKMAKLPPQRIDKDAAVFQHIGCDMAGPLYCWLSKKVKTEIKVYFLIFSCSVSRNIHLELLEECDTHSFLNAFRSFCGQVGTPLTVNSDNGGIFKKGNKELQNLWRNIDPKMIQERVLSDKIRWSFNTPLMPNAGGHFERLISNVKTLIKKNCGRRNLTLNQLGGLLKEIQGMVNSRPLLAETLPNGEISVLTPFRIATGKTNKNLLPDCYKLKSENPVVGRELLEFSKQRHDCLRQLWNSMCDIYFPTLSPYSKWQNVQKRVPKIGEVVLVKENNLKQNRNYWPIGRVEELVFGRDNLCRTVKLRMSAVDRSNPFGSKIVTRPINLVYPLEASEEGENDESVTNSPSSPADQSS